MSEGVAFLLGGLTRMPAVQAFAFYSVSAGWASGVDLCRGLALCCA